MSIRRSDSDSGIILYGAGGHCKVVIDILRSLGKNIDFIIDDNPKDELFMGYPLRRPFVCYPKAIITVGNCSVRRNIVKSISVNDYVTAVHPSAIVADTASIGYGTVVVHGAIVQACAKVGNHCILNTKSSVEHDVVVHDFVHIASGATVCGGAEIGEGTWIGAGSVVRQGIKIGRNCMIGAGSVVVKDIPDDVTAFGNPAKVKYTNSMLNNKMGGVKLNSRYCWLHKRILSYAA